MEEGYIITNGFISFYGVTFHEKSIKKTEFSMTMKKINETTGKLTIKPNNNTKYKTVDAPIEELEHIMKALIKYIGINIHDNHNICNRSIVLDVVEIGVNAYRDYWLGVMLLILVLFVLSFVHYLIYGD